MSNTTPAAAQLLVSALAINLLDLNKLHLKNVSLTFSSSHILASKIGLNRYNLFVFQTLVDFFLLIKVLILFGK